MLKHSRPLAATAVAGILALTAGLVAQSAGAAEETGHAASASRPAAAPAPQEPLRILLTNDDGWTKPGITAAYEALTAAGHDVTLVGPKTNQSGMSASMPEAEMHVGRSETDPHVFSVDSSPANAMDVGVLAIMDEKPDLVVSGINSGANTGGFIGISGTVGATVAARALYGIPGIAISLEQSSSRKADYLGAAQLLVDLIDRGVGYIQDGTVLNVNYPELAAGEQPRDVVYAEPSDAVPYVWDFDLRTDGGLDFSYEVADLPTSGDIAELAKDNITLTLIRTTAGGAAVPAARAGAVRKLADSLD